MAINIQTLLDVINAKITAGVAAGSTDSDRLVTLTAWRDNHQNAAVYSTFADLPNADSSNAGAFFKVGADSAATYYVSWKNKWKEILSTDSDAVGGQAVPSTPLMAPTLAYGYMAGGIAGDIPGPQSFTVANHAHITKFSFSSGVPSSVTYMITGTNPADPTAIIPFGPRGNSRGRMSPASSDTHAYMAGGWVGPTANASNATDVIDKFSFGSATAINSVGSLTATGFGGSGASSSDYGWVYGGWTANSAPQPTGLVPGYPGFKAAFATARIEKFPFASDNDATETGSSLSGSFGIDMGGHSTPSYGYGSSPTAYQKYPFSSGSSVSTVGSLSQPGYMKTTATSPTNGYYIGGSSFWLAYYNNPSFPSEEYNAGKLQKFSFASDTNTSTLTDMTPQSPLVNTPTYSPYFAGQMPSPNLVSLRGGNGMWSNHNTETAFWGQGETLDHPLVLTSVTSRYSWSFPFSSETTSVLEMPTTALGLSPAFSPVASSRASSIFRSGFQGPS